MELIIAIFIFSLVMTASVGIFSAVIKGYRHAKVIQRDLEDAQAAMNSLAKSLRASAVVLCEGNNCGISASYYSKIRVFDYSQEKCIEYEISDIYLKQKSANLPVTNPEPISWCVNNTTFGATDDLVADVKSGSFYVRPEITTDSPNNQVARITVALKICPNGICSAGVNDAAVIQSTVSLRPSETEYKEVGL